MTSSDIYLQFHSSLKFVKYKYDLNINMIYHSINKIKEIKFKEYYVLIMVL